jgi:MbtH protein
MRGVAMAERPEIFKVVRNTEEQYSIWAAGRPNPVGWFDEGTIGTKAECLEHIEEIWIDMRPLSVRRRMTKLS